MGITMKYQENRQRLNEEYEERLELVMDRIREISRRPEVLEPFAFFFQKVAEDFLLEKEIADKCAANALAEMDEEIGKNYNKRLYQDVQEENYGCCYGNPAYAVSELGAEYGQLLCALYAQCHSFYPSLFQGEYELLCIYAELFVEIYNCFEDEELSPSMVREVLYSFMHDYSEVFNARGVANMVDPDSDYFYSVLMESDGKDPAYLYRYGLYIGENERRISAYLDTLSQEEIQSMADTYTEGYRIGFEMAGKDLSIKTSVQVRYPVGFERMVRAAIGNFEMLQLRCVLQPYSSSANKQYEFDHREDRALWLDKAYIERNLETLRVAFENRKKEAAGMAGPAVVEVFGEEPFAPVSTKERVTYDGKQHQLVVYETGARGRITNEYIIAEERSFTIIAYPVPSIGEQFEEIFRETVKINTLDYKLYQTMQQKLIDVLDTADRVHIQGANGNRTDLYVNIYKLQDPSKETAFENCVADVNIPVGEVFTSPVLKGTNGKLHVSQVYLNGLDYRNLEIDFQDGMIAAYNCTNFDAEEENRKYIKDNILMHHETLPMGEFAIGTNTTAFCMARVYDIAAKLPILIAEKTGPHFAVGDTCYSYDEDNITYNPDGKAIVARENEVSAQRKTDASKAYLNCHTDITIPYDELGAITVIRKDGTTEDIIRDGRFVVPGTEALNQPLDELEQRKA